MNSFDLGKRLLDTIAPARNLRDRALDAWADDAEFIFTPVTVSTLRSVASGLEALADDVESELPGYDDTD